jgi:hypothetical protein
VGPLKPRKLADVLPISAPSRAELWRRQRLALSVLDKRGASAATAALVRQILLGASVDELKRG